MHDGSDFMRFSGLQTVLDNLIHRLEIPPLIAVLIDSQQRLREYADDERHADFLAKELVPVLEERYPLVRDPTARGLLGASFGAVASLSAAWRHPGTFGNLCLLSGSFAFTDIGDHDRGPAFDPVVSFVNAFREAPGRPAERLYLACGTYESLIYYNRSMVPLLQETGMEVRYAEARDGHNWENWRDRLRGGSLVAVPRSALDGVRVRRTNMAARKTQTKKRKKRSSKKPAPCRDAPDRAVTRRRRLLAHLLRGHPRGAGPLHPDRRTDGEAARLGASASTRSGSTSRRATTSSSTA